MKIIKITPNLLQRFSWLIIRPILILFCSLEIIDIKNLKKIKGGFILASNHTSELDPLIIVACMPFFSNKIPLYFVSREREFYGKNSINKYIYGGTFFRLMGAYPAYVGLKDYDAALKNHLKLLKSGKNVHIFPTGKIDNSESPKAKGGLGFLAHKTDLPVIPLRIICPENITFSRILSRKVKIKLIFGEPLVNTELCFDDDDYLSKNKFENFSNIIMEKIINLK
jgi:1-acyl-sn-glycerol-3-phosphate acyltransferase